MSKNYGYACINMQLSNPQDFGGHKNDRITTNRTMIKRTFQEKGIEYASSLALLNILDLQKVLEWNVQHGINFFRLSSNVFPWASEYQLHDMPDYEAIYEACERSGNYIRQHGIRITSHPGPFNKLASPKERVFENTKRDLEIHGEFFDMLGLPRDHYAKINIHVGAAYNNKPVALDTFARNFERLPVSVTSRLTVENDDRQSLYSTQELYDGVFTRTGIPIVFDYHHHGFCTGDLTEKQALEMAISTWGDIKPVVHYSESRAEEKKDAKIRPHAHSDYVNGPVDDYGYDLDVMIEAKAKELALFNLKKNDAERLTAAA
jgi:UV DNA damage endonuclease